MSSSLLFVWDRKNSFEQRFGVFVFLLGVPCMDPFHFHFCASLFEPAEIFPAHVKQQEGSKQGGNESTRASNLLCERTGGGETLGGVSELLDVVVLDLIEVVREHGEGDGVGLEGPAVELHVLAADDVLGLVVLEGVDEGVLRDGHAGAEEARDLGLGAVAGGDEGLVLVEVGESVEVLAGRGGTGVDGDGDGVLLEGKVEAGQLALREVETGLELVVHGVLVQGVSGAGVGAVEAAGAT
eukprot:259899_1